VGQHFAIDALMSPDIDLVILRGEAGTSKTFLSVVAAMQGYQIDLWKQIICTRNNVEMDSNSIGALPGSEVEKIAPLMRGVTDNLRRYLVLQGAEETDAERTLEDYIEQAIIKFEALSFMRGRSLADQFILLDECQNATPHQVYSIITRVGENCKCVLTGDERQIDDINLDSKNNGLVFAAERMRGYSGAAQLYFDDNEVTRGELAKAAIERMSDYFL
jgi:PhoH-like ATPase